MSTLKASKKINISFPIALQSILIDGIIHMIFKLKISRLPLTALPGIVLFFCAYPLIAAPYEWVKGEMTVDETTMLEAEKRIRMRDITTELQDAYRFDRYKEISFYIEQLQSIAPESAEFAYFKALEYYTQGEKGFATVYLKESLGRNDSFDPAWNLLGLIYKNAGNFSDAKSSFEKAHEASPYNPEYVYNLASTYYSTDNYKEAKTLAQLSLEYKSNFSEAYYLLGLIYSRENQINESLNNYKLAMNSGLSGTQFYTDYLKMAFEARDDKTTILLADKLHRTKSPVTHRLLGSVRMRYGEFARASRHYKAIINLSEDNQDDLKNYIYSLHRSGSKVRSILRSMEVSDEKKQIMENYIRELEESPTHPEAVDRIVNPVR